MAIKLSDEDAEEMAGAIENLLDMYSYCSQSSDYKCAWCGNRARINGESVKHTDDCNGNKFLKLLRPAPIE